MRVEDARARERTWRGICRGRRSGRRNIERVDVDLLEWEARRWLLSYLMCEGGNYGCRNYSNRRALPSHQSVFHENAFEVMNW